LTGIVYYLGECQSRQIHVLIATRATIERFFKPFVDQILDSLHEQLDDNDVKYILLVGGFGDSQYLREQLVTEFPISRCQIITVNDST